MQSVKKQIISNLQKAIKYLTGLDIVSTLEHSTDERHGDYSSNIAMAIFSSSKFKVQSSKWRSPIELAEKMAETLNSQLSTLNFLDKVEAVAPGFINFWLSKDYLTTLMIRIIRAKDKYGKSERLDDKKIMVEFTDPNPFKEFHIGHLYSNIVGESICRLLEANGAIVKRANYQGDVGMHVAKALYGLLSAKFKVQSSKLEEKSLVQRIKLLGEAYALGGRMFEEDEEAKKEIEKINKQIYEKEPKIMPLYKKGREWSLEYFDKIYSRLGTKFKKYYFEGEMADIGLKMVREHIGDAFEESKGALIFPGEKFGLHNRVFVNSLGIPTYEAKDLGLAPTKYKDFPYDLSIIITANEQSDYFSVVLKALSLIEPKLAQKTKHIAHGVVRLKVEKEGSPLKMSSRTGSVILGEWLINEAKHRIITKYKEMDQDIAEKVAVGAVKYAFLKSGIGRDIEFNFDESVSLEGNSGPYLQYTFARTQSVLRKSEIRSTKSQANSNNQNTKFKNYKFEPEEASLLRTVYRFPEVVEEAAEKFAPNLLCNYLFDLAQKFNLFYQRVPIIKQQLNQSAGAIGTSQFRLSLTMAVGQIIKNGLYLLGISAPERM